MGWRLRIAVASSIGAVLGVLALALSPEATQASGAQWSIVKNPNPVGSTLAELNAVSCTSPTACVAIGDYTEAEGGYLSLAESWNGNTWTIQSTPNLPGATDDLLDGLSCVGTRWCTAVGSTLSSRSVEHAFVEAWNGKRWAIEPTPLPGAKGTTAGLDAVSCTGADSCMAVGGFTPPGVESQEQPLAEYWNGSAWSIVATPNPQAENGSFLDGVSCTAQDACTAGGDYAYADVDQSIFALRWVASTWTMQNQVNPVGQSDNADSSVSCSGSMSCTSAGFWTNGGDQVEPLAEVWNGSTWRRQRTPSPVGAAISQFNGISCVSGPACMAVGNASANSSYLTYPLAEYWNGTRWNITSTPNPTGGQINILSAVECSSSTICMAVGSSWNGKITQTLVEAYSG